MRNSWLVQRLRRPVGGDNPFAFGGGLMNGGLSSEAMTMLRNIFSFDYMGSAEFEFGAVPKALQALAADHARLASFEFDIDLSTVPADWSIRETAEPLSGSAPMYSVCRIEHMAEVVARARGWATGEERLKDPTLLSRTLRPYRDWDGQTVGWLELDNGFFLFADREMWVKVALLFGACDLEYVEAVA